MEAIILLGFEMKINNRPQESWLLAILVIRVNL